MQSIEEIDEPAADLPEDTLIFWGGHLPQGPGLLGRIGDAQHAAQTDGHDSTEGEGDDNV